MNEATLRVILVAGFWAIFPFLEKLWAIAGRRYGPACAKRWKDFTQSLRKLWRNIWTLGK